MMIKVLDTSENFSTSEKKKKLNPSLQAKMLKIDIFLYETICTNETNRFLSKPSGGGKALKCKVTYWSPQRLLLTAIC